MTLVRKYKPPSRSSRINLNTILRSALILVAYIIAFTSLDFLTRGFQVFQNIVPWYPTSRHKFRSGFSPWLALCTRTLTSDRPYRAAWSGEKTLDYNRSLRGSHFDPQVVENFLEMLGEDN